MTLLIYPRSKPYGANSTNSRSAISESAAYPTEVIDYLKFNILDPIDDTIEHTLYLYLPSKLSETYTAKYNGVELGAVGNAAVNAAKGAIDAGGIGDSFAADVKQFASAAKPALGYSMGAGIINQVVQKTGGSGSLSRDNLSALTQKKVFNPYEETIFQGTTFRDHTFSFKMAPKDATDVQTIVKIINTFRQSMLPGKDGENWLTLPYSFQMEIMRYESKGGDEILTAPGDKKGVLATLMRFPNKMVMTNMSVDLSPDGNYSSLQTRIPGADQTVDYGPVSYNMTLSFQETKYLTREDYPNV